MGIGYGKKTFGGSKNDGANALQVLPNGSMVIAGFTNSYGSGTGKLYLADIDDIYVLKLDKDGNKIWEKTFGGSGNDIAEALQVLPDGSMVIAGYTNSYGAGGYDIYVLKLDKDGNMIWQKTVGSEGNDFAYALQVLKDGNIIVAGCLATDTRRWDVYVLKLDRNGNKIWEKTFGGSEGDVAHALQVLPDGDIVVAGWTTSYGARNKDVYLLKITESLFTIKNNVPLLSSTGKVLTRLPIATKMKILFEKGNSYYVQISPGLKGWINKNDVSARKPDMMKPVIRIISKNFDDPYLYLKGVVYDDKGVKEVKFGDEILERVSFAVDKGNYRDAYPFEKKILVTPGMDLTVRAWDVSGKESKLPIVIEEPVVDYTPEYTVLKVKKTAIIRSGPGERYKKISMVSSGMQLTSIGYKGDWYYLEGGGWVYKGLVEKERFNVPEVREEVVSVKAERREVSLPKAVDVDVNIPEGYRRPNTIGIIIANKDYEHRDVPEVKYAFHDAEVMKEYFIKTLGIPERNVYVIKDAKKSDFEMWFGTEKDPKGKLYRLVRPGTRPEIYIYYVGHGAPDVETRSAYFVPVDAHPSYVNLSGYSLKLFYRNLSEVPSSGVNVIIEACFSGGSPGGMLIAKASPLGVVRVGGGELPRRFTVITATDTSGEIASWYPEKGHSLFTYYLMKGMGGAADKNRDREITLSEMEEYLVREVSYMAGRLYNREQHPMVRGDLGKVFVRLR